MSESLAVSIDGPTANVRLNRPIVRNALDGDLIAALTKAFLDFHARAELRAVLLEGAGAIFCGGADIQYMRKALDLDEQQNYEDALRLSDLFAAIDDCPIPTIAKVQGAALGGGAGLVAACDIVIAADDALFGFTEAKLGIVPAVISPFVVRKIGAGHARALFTTAERFSAERALRIGLVHEMVPPSQLDASTDGKMREVLTSGPTAARMAKKIAKTAAQLERDEARSWTARQIAQQRVGPEGQEGLRSFLEKRRPDWH
ncbi:MAG: enoyl-CoA hydratase [Candidatus Eremiobacter antarcticus]|nr:enoyl-CoA hydratase/isomerase family protein [Candidatus Eremiobacteraeota bacterium]MBC5808675.1 enoyl-CoA hydratase/isomerase family protein [Candidatus Eremiobacteraeota bacterium]PZR62161.1 MAG: enoyl-CoA hydratase [Candidatus Eremiobacter sp. RRmetagenome_bin22]